MASRRGVQLWTKNWGDMPAETASVDQGVVMFGQTTEYFKCYSFAAKNGIFKLTRTLIDVSYGDEGNANQLFLFWHMSNILFSLF